MEPEEKARKSPGALTSDGIEKMSEYLCHRAGIKADKSGDAASKLAPVVTAYLTSVLMPSQSGMSMRNARELQSLAQALDALIMGDVAMAADTLTQRFKAVETAAVDGNWNIARHYETIPESKVTSVTMEERERAARKEKDELRLQAVVSASGLKGGAGAGAGR